MARVTTIGVDGKLRCLTADAYDKPGAALKKILARRAKRNTEAGDDEEDLDAESAKEKALQDLIELHPDVLPWEAWPNRVSDQGEQILTKVLSVGRNVGGIPVDLLLLEAWDRGDGSCDARFVIVETKLARNSEIEREVLGQVLEYGAQLAAALASEGDSRLLQDAGADWEHRAGEAFGSGWRGTTWASACARAQRGDIRLLIVSDAVPRGLCQTLAFMPSGLLIGAVDVTFHENDTGGFAVGNLLAATQTNEALANWKRWAGSMRLSVATVQAIATGDGKAVVATAVPTYDTKSRNVRPKIDIEEVLKASTAEWQTILRNFADMLDDLGDECLDLDPGTNYLSYKVPVLEMGTAAVMRLAKNKLVLRTSYLHSFVQDLEREKRPDQAQKLEEIVRDFRQGLKNLGFQESEKGKGLYKVTNAAHLRDPALRQNLVNFVCDIARRVQALT